MGCVLPTTTSTWIWPSNGKILRGPLQKFWILQLMEVFVHLYMTNCFYIYFRWLKARGSMIFHWLFYYDCWWFIFPILFLSHELIGGWIYLLWISFDGIGIFYLIWVVTYPSEVFQVVYLCLPFSPFQWPFSPFEGFWFLTFIKRLFSKLNHPKMFIRAILPRIFKSISFQLNGFWESWLFNYPLTFILYFPTLNLVYWHGTKGVLSFDVSWTHVSNFSSIRWGNPKSLVR